jgi:imidazolonepropionase-like amidohydrolase
MADFVELPEAVRHILEKQLIRAPRSEAEARRQVRELHASGVDAIKAILDSGETDHLLPRMDVSLLHAVAEESAVHGLPLFVHTGSQRDVRDALDAAAAGLEHGTYRELLSPELLTRMATKHVFYDPTLSVLEARAHVVGGVEELLDRPLVRQVTPLSIMERAREVLRSRDPAESEYERIGLSAEREQARQNLLAAWNAGVPLVAGSDAGNPLVLHGPTIHRELQLWVEAGVPESDALQAATFNAARCLGVENRLGLVEEGYEANLLLVDGNPLTDITSTERIALVIFKGERVRRSSLFENFD